MHRVFRKISIVFCILLIMVSTTSCSKQKETLTIQDWITLIVHELAIPASNTERPYYLNVQKDHDSFGVVQAAVEWGILSKDVALDLKSELTNEWVAYTLMNSVNMEESDVKIKDSNKSSFPKQIASSVGLGLFDLDGRGCFGPKKVISKEAALQKLHVIKTYINDYEVEIPVYDIDLNKDIVEVEVPPSFDELDKKAVFHSMDNIKEGSIVHWNDGSDRFYRVIEVDPNQQNSVVLDDVEFQDIADKVEIEDSFELDFSEAEIDILAKEFSSQDAHVQKTISKEFEVLDFKGDVDVSAQGLTVSIEKGELHANLKVFKVKPTVRWKTSGSSIEDAYFKLAFSTSEVFKVEPKKTLNMYSDFNDLNATDFVNRLLRSFKISDEMEGTTIPICQIRVPFPNVPLLTLTMQLKLHIYASGKLELSLTNQHSMGLEIRNNKLRTFSEHERNVDFIMKATAASTLGLTTGVLAGNVSLMDLGIKGGVRGYVDTIVHLYDTNGSMDSKEIKVPLDKVDEASLHNEEVKVCGNMNLHWVLDLIVNTKKTMAAKVGLTKTWNVLNENNAKIILNKKTHIENWQFMERCTRKSRKQISTKEPIHSDKIVLEKINVVIDLNESKKVSIVTLPAGYSLSDLQFSSNNAEVCAIDSNGILKPSKRGSAMMTIKTVDSKYSVHCNVLVTDKSKHDLSNT